MHGQNVIVRARRDWIGLGSRFYGHRDYSQFCIGALEKQKRNNGFVGISEEYRHGFPVNGNFRRYCNHKLDYNPCLPSKIGRRFRALRHQEHLEFTGHTTVFKFRSNS